VSEGQVPRNAAIPPEHHPHEGGGAGTRRRILAVALELFAVKGYAGTSIRDITDRMGLTKAALYYHFASKEQILEAVTAPLKDEFTALAKLANRQPHPPPAEILTALVDALSRRVALIRIVMGDPSSQRHKSDGPRELLDLLAAAIADDTSPDAILRSRCAIGAAQFGVFVTASEAIAADPPFAGPPDDERSERILGDGEHLLGDDQRGEIVAAALRALS
jgi:TetR/AcrR family transcriptional regulator, regulator of cefoperazone and chloramphenicol sensitivity